MRPSSLIERQRWWAERLILLTLCAALLCLSGSGCSAVEPVAKTPEVILPQPPDEARLRGAGPMPAKVGETEGYFVPEVWLDELTRELFDSRAWIRSVLLMHGQRKPAVARSGPAPKKI